MAFRVEIQPRAWQDLDAIATYLVTRSSFRLAELWFNNVIAAIATLVERPERCPVATEFAVLGAEIRLLLFGRRNHQYKIYFSVAQNAASDGTVRILHVRHGARHGPDVDELEDLMDELLDE